MNTIETQLLELKAQLGQIIGLVKNTNENEIMTSAEVMKMLKISRNSYNRLKDEGIIKVYSLRGKLYCKRSEILETVESGRIN